MTELTMILNVSNLQKHIEAGNIARRYHPQYPELAILNYTEKAAFARAWDNETRTCRGLIYNTETLEVLARPFSKFHNFDEPEAPTIGLDRELYHWANKEDGSLGILYRDPTGYPRIATRGSFSSEQALRGTEILHASGLAWVFDERITAGYTPLFEIIYPENRIVLDYGKRVQLIQLGSVRISDGAFFPVPNKEERTLRQLLEDVSRPNAEGWVAWANQHTAVKIKQSDYVELHRIVTGLNRKSVWRALKEGEPTFKALIEQLPDELYAWAETVAKELREEYATHIRDIDGWYISTLEQDVWAYDVEDFYHAYIATDIDRKKFALTVKNGVNGITMPENYKSFMFSLLDGRDIQDRVWDMVEPKGGDK